MTEVDKLPLLKHDGIMTQVSTKKSRKPRPPEITAQGGEKDKFEVPRKEQLLIIQEDENLFLQLEKDFFDKIAEIQEGVVGFQRDVCCLEKHLEAQYLKVDTQQPLSIRDSLENPFNDNRNQDFAELNAKAAHLHIELIKLEKAKVSVLPGREKLFYSMVTSVRIRLRTLLEKYNDIQLSYREKTRQRLLRQAYIAMPGATEEQLQQVVESGRVETIFYDQILNDQNQEKARTAMLLLQEQQRDLFCMEESIQELYRLFIDVTYMISNDTTLRKIQDSMDKVKPAVHNSNITLHQTERDVKERRQNQIIFWTGVAGVALLSTAATLMPLLLLA